jgi:hypothetical protein
MPFAEQRDQVEFGLAEYGLDRTNNPLVRAELDSLADILDSLADIDGALARHVTGRDHFVAAAQLIAVREAGISAHV